jgi:hypothetical protein
VVACREIMPYFWDLADCLHDGLDELLTAAQAA